MGQDQRYAAPSSRPLVNEVDINTIKLGSKLIKGVELVFLGTPIELLGPIRKQLSEVREVSALLPRIARCLTGPACLADTRSQVG